MLPGNFASLSATCSTFSTTNTCLKMLLASVQDKVANLVKAAQYICGQQQWVQLHVCACPTATHLKLLWLPVFMRAMYGSCFTTASASAPCAARSCLTT